MVGDADQATRLFGVSGFDRVLISYALSMIAPWREALAQAFDVVARDGLLVCVDFADCADLPAAFGAGLRGWLSLFDVKPVDWRQRADGKGRRAVSRGARRQVRPENSHASWVWLMIA